MWDIKQKATNRLTDTANSTAVTRGGGGWGKDEDGKGVKYKVTGDRLGGEHTLQCIEDVLQNCTPETA